MNSKILVDTSVTDETRSRTSMFLFMPYQGQEFLRGQISLRSVPLVVGTVTRLRTPVVSCFRYPRTPCPSLPGSVILRVRSRSSSQNCHRCISFPSFSRTRFLRLTRTFSLTLLVPRPFSRGADLQPRTSSSLSIVYSNL